MRPTTEKLKYIDLSRGTSQDFNLIVKSISSDITNAFNAVNDNQERLLENQDTLIQENLFLRKKVDELLNHMQEIEALYENRQYKIFKTYSSSSEIMNSGAHHDTEYGILTLPYRDSQKSHINLYPKEFLLKNIQITLTYWGVNAEGTTVTEEFQLTSSREPNLINILNYEPSSIWTKTLEMPEEVTKVYANLQVKLPQRILTTLFINSLGIKPHPLYSMDLHKIEYVDANNLLTNLISTYPTEMAYSEVVPSVVSEIGNVRFMFPAVMANEISIFLSQGYSFKAGEKKHFVIGLKAVDIENMSITSEQESFVTELRVPTQGVFFKRIMAPKAISAIDNIDLRGLITHELYMGKNDTEPFSFGREINADKTTVYIKTTIRRDGETIPALKGMEFSYEPK